MFQVKTVLVVEDDKLYRMALRMQLADAGYRVLEAVDCESARVLLGGDHRVDAATLDYNLPDGTGFDLLDEILRRHPDVPAILITAHPTNEGKEQAIALGACRYLEKPTDLTQVVAVVSEALGVRTP